MAAGTRAGLLLPCLPDLLIIAAFVAACGKLLRRALPGPMSRKKPLNYRSVAGSSMPRRRQLRHFSRRRELRQAPWCSPRLCGEIGQSCFPTKIRGWVMSEVWLRPTRRALGLGTLPPLVLSGIGGWMVVGDESAAGG